MPKARLKEGLALSGSGKVSASIDSSGRLSMEFAWAWTIKPTLASHLIWFQYPTRLKSSLKQNGLDVAELALHGGEEYELVLTVKPDGWDAAIAAVENGLAGI